MELNEMEKLRPLSDADCMDPVRDIQENPSQLNTNPLISKKTRTDISRTHQSIRQGQRRQTARMGWIR